MKFAFTVVLTAALFLPGPGMARTCSGHPERGSGGVRNSWSLSDGGFAAFGKMNINLDGYGRAYNQRNYDGGAVIHLCNAGEVFLPDGSSFQGSESQATCTGRFMGAFKHIGQAGWKDPSVGAIEWYGILGIGTAKIHGRLIHGVEPVLQPGGSGFYVSPTSFFDATVKDSADQARYINPLRVPAAVVPASLVVRGIKMGTFGVAIDTKKNIPVPFVVSDGGPRVGEGSAALARLAAGRPTIDRITRQTRDVGQVDAPEVLWVFFGGQPTTYDHTQEEKLAVEAKQAFEHWGGQARLRECIATVPRN